MNNAYRNFMQKQCVSEEARQAFYDGLGRKKRTKTRSVLLKIAAAAACILVALPVTLVAVENLFGISLVKSVIGRTSTGQDGIGYEVTYAGVATRPLADFAEDVQNIDGHMTKVYDSWQDAEAELGVELINNPVLFGDGVLKESSYDLRVEGLPERVHCFASYHGKDGQFYRATVTAGYRYDNMSVTVHSTVTCEHPAIAQADQEGMHWSGVLYEEDDVAEILQEQYTTANGIPVTIISVTKAEGRATNYEATFAANGASYRITLYPNVRDDSRNAAAKAHLIEILDGFVF